MKKTIGLIIITIGAVFSLGILASTTSASAGAADFLFTAGFYLWVALPFLVLVFLTLYLYRKPHSTAARLAILFTSFAVAAASVWIYWTSIYGPSSSTSALVFVFIPVYSLIATAIFFGLSWQLLRAVKPEILA